MSVDEVDEFGVDTVAQSFLYGGNCFGAGDAEPSDEPGLQTGCFHGGGDRLAAPVNEDGIDPGYLKEDDVAHERAHQVGIVHGGPPDLDEERFSPEALQVGQGFDQGGGFVFGGQREETGDSKVPSLPGVAGKFGELGLGRKGLRAGVPGRKAENASRAPNPLQLPPQARHSGPGPCARAQGGSGPCGCPGSIRSAQ